MEQISSFIVFLIISTYTPGPNNIMSLNNALHVRMPKALHFNAGMFVGFFTVMLLCALFSAALYGSFEHIRTLMAIIGSSYMLYLAYKTYNSSLTVSSDNKSQSFTSGFLLQFINPKIMLYGLTALGSYILPYYESWYSLVLFALLLAAVGASANISWALCGSIFKKLLTNHGKIINTLMSLALVYCAIDVIVALF